MALDKNSCELSETKIYAEKISAFTSAKSWHVRSVNDDYSFVKDTILYPEKQVHSECSDTDAAAPRLQGEVSRPDEHHHIAYRTFSTWCPSNDNLIELGQEVTLTLEIGQSITLIGDYTLLVRKGTISFYGAVLQPAAERHHVFVPATHALPPIICIDGPSVIVVSPSQRPISELGTLSPLFRNIWAVENSRKDRAVKHSLLGRICFYIQHSYEDHRQLTALLIPHQWLQLFQEYSRLSQNSGLEIMVLGAKNAGKSTFSRVLVNYLVSKRTMTVSTGGADQKITEDIYWLELDPGQPEFGPPGQISLVKIQSYLFGPPYTHTFVSNRTLNQLIWAHSVGNTTPTSNASHYMRCVSDLYSRFRAAKRANVEDVLIINTPGWTPKGPILDLNVRIMQKLQIAILVVLNENDSNIFAPSNCTAAATKLHYVPGAITSHRTLVRSPMELREMQTISYFHAIQGTSDEDEWVKTPLLNQMPLSLCYHNANADILGLLTQHEHVSRAFLGTLFDKELVALCVLDDGEFEHAFSSVERNDLRHLPTWALERGVPKFQLSPENSRIVGWALISNIDSDDHVVDLHTPLRFEIEESSTVQSKHSSSRVVLLRGTTDLPVWAYMEEVFEKTAKQQEQLPNRAFEVNIHLHEPQIQFGRLQRLYDMGLIERQREIEPDYLRKTNRRETTPAGQKHWNQKPRVSRDARPH